mgnify:CR=1 FL=1
MKSKLIFNIILLFLFIYKFSYAQDIETIVLEKSSEQEEPYFFHLHIDGNIQKNSITCITQDSTGQMWFATKDGLIRYDTKTFYSYRKDPENKHSIGGSFVEEVFTDRKGNIWIGTEPGVVSKYNSLTNQFDPIKGITGDRIKDIKQDKNGTLWISSNTALYNYDISTQQLHTYKPDDPTIGLDRLLITSDNSIWITTNENYIFEFSSKSFRKLQIIPEKEHLTHKSTQVYSAYYLEEDYKGDTWISTPYGYLLKYDPKNEQLSKYIFEDLSSSNNKLDNGLLTVMFLFEDSYHKLWMGTWFNGLYKISANRKSVMQFTSQPDLPNSLSNTIVHSGFQDKSGNLWFGTEFAGINILKEKNKFLIISHNSDNSNSLSTLLYKTAAVDNHDRVWVGSPGGQLYYFNKNKPQELISVNLPPTTSKWDWIYSMHFDSKGFLWIGTDSGLIKYHPDTKEVVQYHHNQQDASSILSNAITSIAEESNGTIWVGTSIGLSKLNKDGKSFYHFTHDKDDPKSLSSNLVSCLFVDRRKNIWVGTIDGLNKLNATAGNFTRFKQSYDNENSISANIITSIYEKDNHLWIATNNGLNSYDFETKEFEYFDETDGLPSNNIKAISGNKGTNELWFTTPYHIVKFNTTNFQFVTYDKSDGINNNAYIEDLGQREFEFINNFALRDKSGSLYFGGLTGMCLFHPDSLPLNNYQAPIILKDFIVNGSSQKISKSIILNSNQNNLEVSIILLNYIQPEKNNYAFYMENYDSIWQYTGNKNSLQYFNLPKGTYKLHFKGANNDGVWTLNKNPLIITIKPQFYQTKYFYLLAIGLVILMVLFFSLHKFYLLRKLSRQKELMRYTNSNLSSKKISEINKLLLEKLNTDDLYLDADLSLQKLASSIKVNPNNLSQVINQVHHKNFNEFINTYRLVEAKKLLKTTSLKIEGVAFDSGFNSLSTFNAYFKKETGKTPSAYRKQFS